MLNWFIIEQSMEKDKTVVISDLHIDTWSRDNKISGKTKFAHFIDFLNWIKPFTARLIINGDLVDAPPPKGHDIFPTYHNIFQSLINLTKSMEVYYFIGNHDIGLWGLKVKDFNKLNIAYVSYPRLYIKFEDNSYVYVEHGHTYDPVLSLYIYEAVKSINPRGGILNRIKNIFNRLRGKKESKDSIFDRESDITALNRVVVRASQRRDLAGNKTQPNGVYNWQDYWQNVETWLWKKLTPLINTYYKPFNWKEAADDIFEKYAEDYQNVELKGIILGHTHQPDEHVIDAGRKKGFYLNSGDWSEPFHEKDPDTHHSSFIILDKFGEPERDKDGNAVRDFIVEQYG